MASFALLEQADEDKLHATRLLSVEEKPFKRLTKRLLASTSPIQAFSSSRLPTPPAEDTAAAPTDEASSEHQQPTHDKYLAQLEKFRTDVLLDFAAFDASIARLQFLRSANAKERARYTAEKDRILGTAQDVRENTANLRVQLEEAKRTLEVRKTYDELAEKIVKDERLKPRAEQSVAIEKLRVEIEDLEREGRDLEVSWVERREVWKRVVNEGQRVRRVVRGEPEEEEKPGPGEGEMDGGERMLDTMHGHSGAATPMPVMEEAPTPEAMLDDAPTPQPSSHMGSLAMTPRPDEVITAESDAAMTDDETRGPGTPQPVRSKLNIVETAHQSEDQMDTT